MWIAGNFAAFVALAMMNPAGPSENLHWISLGNGERLLEDISGYVLLGFVVLSPVVAIWASKGLNPGLRVAAAMWCLFMAFSVAFLGVMAVDNALGDWARPY